MTRKLIYDICSKFYFKSTRASATTRMCCVAVVSDEERQYLRFFSFQLKIPDRYVLHFLTSFIYRYWEDYYMPKLPECTVQQPKWSLQSAAHGQTKKSRIFLVVPPMFCEKVLAAKLQASLGQNIPYQIRLQSVEKCRGYRETCPGGSHSNHYSGHYYFKTPSVVKIPRVDSESKTKNYFIGGQRSEPGGKLLCRITALNHCTVTDNL